MADLADIKKVGEELVPLIRDLFARARADKQKNDRSGEIAVVKRLRKLNSEAASTTPASLNERLGAMVANHTALTEVLIEAAGSQSVVDEAEMHAVRVQRRSLDDAIGDVLIREAFDPINTLLSNTTIDEIESSLKKAEDDIADRQQAKATLDNIIGVAMTSAKIVTKLAVL